MSMITNSLENLVRILPTGLESKNRIGDLTMFLAIYSWIFLVADKIDEKFQ